MTGFRFWKAAAFRTLLACLMFTSMSPAQATRSEETYERAVNTYNEALAAAKRGDYDTACHGFKLAADLYESAIYGLMDYPMQTEEQRDNIKRVSKSIQADADDAKNLAKQTCGVAQNAGADDLEAQQSAVLGTIRLAESQYQDADRKHKAGDHAGACASARLSADNFAKVSRTLKSNRELEATFSQVDQLYANARQVAADRDNVFCRADPGLVQAQPKSSTQLTAQAVTGRFEGAYLCGQGKTALRLDLQGDANGRLTGTFSFGGSNGVPAGSFAMQGRWNADGFVLSGDHWINQPAGFTMVDLAGHLSSPGRLSGEIKAQGCSSFDVARR